MKVGWDLADTPRAVQIEKFQKEVEPEMLKDQEFEAELKEAGTPINETKRSSFDPSFIKSLVPFENPIFCYMDSLGSSGGILCIANSARVALIDFEQRAYTLGILIKDLEINKQWAVGGVYGPCAANEKKALSARDD
ncbi:hypothetical protein H6P81_013131 [Aristolochia fimbriata]|uniref:Uncharacterized protein n=1 Tax=Aristolochia fimbriata TaxID=158543 RepID=A0AAV7EIG0_ARIFI|nr:hypothetical protein H6P81_013131 [Aristolochia fimbriata]